MSTTRERALTFEDTMSALALTLSTIIERLSTFEDTLSTIKAKESTFELTTFKLAARAS